MASSILRHPASIDQSLLHGDQVERVLEKLGHSHFPEPNLQGLQQLYYSWCRKVPFDNSLWLIHLNSQCDMPVPGHSPADFFNNFLKFGTGGLCFPAATAMHALLETIGFESKIVLAWMPDNMHATLVVTIDDKDYLVDQSVPHSQPLLIDADSPEVSPGWRMRLYHQNGRFHYRWMTFRMQSQEEIGCVFDREQYRRSNNAQMLRENSQRYLQCKTWSRYNYNLNTTIFRDELLVRIVEGERQVTISRGGKVTLAALHSKQKVDLLINTFGISEEIVRKLPPDLPIIRQTISIR